MPELEPAPAGRVAVCALHVKPLLSEHRIESGSGLTSKLTYSHETYVKTIPFAA